MIARSMAPPFWVCIIEAWVGVADSGLAVCIRLSWGDGVRSDAGFGGVVFLLALFVVVSGPTPIRVFIRLVFSGLFCLGVVSVSSLKGEFP